MLGDLGKLIVAKGFKKLPKVQLIAQSSHTEPVPRVSLRCLTNSKVDGGVPVKRLETVNIFKNPFSCR